MDMVEVSATAGSAQVRQPVFSFPDVIDPI